MHLDNSACNLASLNLMKFVADNGDFDTAAFCHAVDIMITAQDIIVDNSSYPTPRDHRERQGLPRAGARATPTSARC